MGDTTTESGVTQTPPIESSGADSSASKVRLLPYQQAAGKFWLPKYEEQLLSALLNSSTKTAKLLEGLTTEHFYDSVHVAAFRAILRLIGQHAAINVDSVSTNLIETQAGDPADWAEIVKQLAAVPFKSKELRQCRAQLDLAAEVRGGSSYAFSKYNESFCAELFLSRQRLTRCVRENWYVYRNGVWTKQERDAFRKVVADCIHPEHRTGRHILDLLSNVESRLQVEETAFFGAYKFEGGSILLNVRNGVVIVTDKGQIDIRPHSPDDMFTVQIASAYDPEASCPLFAKFLSEALPDTEDRHFLQVWGGYILYPGCNYQVSAVCHGPSNTGKSTYATAIRTALGPGPCSAVGLEELCKPASYSLPTLKFKMLNIGAELNGTEVEESSQFKMLVSSDELTARQIYGRPESMRTTAKLMFLSNHMPRFRKGGYAEERRLRIVAFNQEPAVKDLQLEHKLAGEGSGILNWMLAGLIELLATGQIPRCGQQSEQVFAMFARHNDRIRHFVGECCVFDPAASITNDALFEGYKAWCDIHGIPTGDNYRSNFFMVLKTSYLQLRYGKPKFAGMRVRTVYGLKSNSQLCRVSTGEGDPPPLTHRGTPFIDVTNKLRGDPKNEADERALAAKKIRSSRMRLRLPKKGRREVGNDTGQG
jgi:P4 family phage/plasmid primase-like protien